MTPYNEDSAVTIYHGDCREILPDLPKVDLVLTDPPYYDVVNESWDKQWKSPREFLEWLEGVSVLVERQMVDNASAYFFASPQMCARVEVMLSGHFRILNNAVWNKGGERKGAAGSGVDVTALRCYWSANAERVIFVEKAGGDDVAKDASGYWDSCEAGKRSVIGDYLKAEFARAGVTNKEVAALFPSKTGGLTGCVSNWLLGANVPTETQYTAMRMHLNARGDEYLRREYEDLRREYEDLRRPFYMKDTDQWGDIWNFPIERTRQHPTQKPMPLISQLARISSRSGNTILDPFMGAGTTGVVAVEMHRHFVGVDLDPSCVATAKSRLVQCKEDRPNE